MADDFFDRELARRMRDPEFRAEFERHSRRIATVDSLVNALDSQREALGMTKAELARACGHNESYIRGLFSKADPNPTIGTFVECADAVGMVVTLQPRGSEDTLGAGAEVPSSYA